MSKNSTKKNKKYKVSLNNSKTEEGPSKKVLDVIVAYSKVTKSVLRNSNTICIN